MRRTKLRVFAAVIAALAVLLVVAVAGARDPVSVASKRPWRPQPAFSARIEDGMGRSLRTFMHGGDTFVLGEPGERFVITVNNPTAQRVEAVISVDGRDAITGQVASLSRSRGYVIPAHGTVRIDGFRQSLDHVAAFRFTSPGSSYSARMGTPQNVGVIGVAFFPERASRPQEIARRDRMRPATKRPAKPSAGASRGRGEADSNLGVGWGETRQSQVMEVRFERMSSSPARVITLRYDDQDGLEARGIDVFPSPRPVVVRPRPFPDARFAPPPR
jgi:hypothetical protein